MYSVEMLPRGKLASRTRSSLKTTGLLVIAALTLLQVLLSAQESSDDLSMLVTQDPERRTVVSFKTTNSDEQGDVVASFVFNSPKGLLGSSNNPSAQDGFRNTEKTLFAVNYQPATKSSFVYLFSKTKAGDLLYIRDINPRVARLLPKPWSDTAQFFLRIESISGRRLNLQTVGFSGSSRQSSEFSVDVSSEGLITLSK
jgi:hypothetical protein